MEDRRVLGYPPSHPPPEWPAGHGARKKCLQNLEGKWVRGQNLDNKRLKSTSGRLAYTAFASTMMS
jgi:hypothetical protein